MLGRIFGWRSRRFFRLEQQRLAKKSVAEIGADVADVVLIYEWERFDAGARFATPPDSAEELIAAMDALYQALRRHDMATKGSAGRGGESFEFYDSGLQAMAESLQARIAK